MTKYEFLARLEQGLAGLPQADITERLNFYGEMIDDRMEETGSEEEAVAALGDIDEIIAQCIADLPLSRLVREGERPRSGLRPWTVVLLILGSPIWLSVLLALSAVAVSLLVALWSVVIALWSVSVAVLVSGIAGVILGLFWAFRGETSAGIALVGAGLVCCGICILLFFGCAAVTKGLFLLTKSVPAAVKKLFMKRRTRACAEQRYNG